MPPKGEQGRLFLECVQSKGVDLPSLGLTEKCIFLGEQTTCTVGRQNQVELFGRIVPSEQQRQWISRNHFELLPEGSGLSLRRLTGNALLVDGAPAPQNVTVALRHDSQIGFCAPESTSPFLIFCVRDQQRHAAGAVLLPNSQQGAAKASSSTFTFECTFARGGDPSKLPLEARTFSFSSNTPVTIGRQHQVGFFEGLFSQDQQCLSFISRSHFEVTPAPGEAGAASLRNLSQNPIMVGQQQIAKGESCKVQAPTLVLFLAGPDHASLACFLKLSLQLHSNGSGPGAVASPPADSPGKTSPPAAPASSHASSSPRAPATFAVSPSSRGSQAYGSSPAANSPPAPSGNSAVSSSPAARSVSPMPAGAAQSSRGQNSAASPRGNAPAAQPGANPQTQILGAAPMTQQLGRPEAAGPPGQQLAAGTGGGGGGGGGGQQPIVTQMLPAQNRPFWLELRGAAVLPGAPPGARRVTTFDGGFTVGRSHQAQMFRQVLRSEALKFVSREHFRIELWGGQFHLIALSGHPVWLVRASDRSRIALGDKQEPCTITSGDCIQFFAGEPDGTRLEDTALYWSFHEGLPPERDHGAQVHHQEPAPPPAQQTSMLPASTLRPVEGATRSGSRGASPAPGGLEQAWPAPRGASPGRGGAGAPGGQGVWNPAAPWGTAEDDWDQDAHDAHWLASALTPRGGSGRMDFSFSHLGKAPGAAADQRKPGSSATYYERTRTG